MENRTELRTPIRNKKIFSLLFSLLLLVVLALSCEIQLPEPQQVVTVVEEEIVPAISFSSVTVVENDASVLLNWEDMLSDDFKEVLITVSALERAEEEVLTFTVPVGHFNLELLETMGCRYKITGLKEKTKYEIAMKTKYRNGKLSDEVTQHVLIKEDGTAPDLSLALSVFEAIKTNSGMAVRWDKDATDSDIAKVKVKLKLGTQLLSTQTAGIEDGELKFNSIDPAKRYTIEAYLIDINDNEQSAVADINILDNIVPDQLSEDAPAAVEGLEIESLDENEQELDEGVLVKWTAPIITSTSDEEILFTFFNEETMARLSQVRVNKDSLVKNRVVKTGIRRSGLFTITARVFKNGRYSTESTVSETVTDTTITSNVELYDLGASNTSIIARWKEPVEGMGILRDYKNVVLTLKDIFDATIKEVTIARGTTQHIFNDLIPNEMYTVIASAEDFNGNRVSHDLQAKKTVQTLSRADTSYPEAVSDIVVIPLYFDSTKARVRVSWTNPSLAVNPDLAAVEITVRNREDKVFGPVNVENIALSTSFYDLPILVRGVDYAFSLVSIDLSGNRGDEENMLYTPPGSTLVNDLISVKEIITDISRVAITVFFVPITAVEEVSYYIGVYTTENVLVSKKILKANTDFVQFTLEDGLIEQTAYQLTLSEVNSLSSEESVKKNLDLLTTGISPATAPFVPADIPNSNIVFEGSKPIVTLQFPPFLVTENAVETLNANGVALSPEEIRYEIYLAEELQGPYQAVEAIKTAEGALSYFVIAGTNPVNNEYSVNLLGLEEGKTYNAGIRGINITDETKYSDYILGIIVIDTSVSSTVPGSPTDVSAAFSVAGTVNTITMDVTAGSLVGKTKSDSSALTASEIQYDAYLLAEAELLDKEAPPLSVSDIESYPNAFVVSSAPPQTSIVANTNIENSETYYIGIRTINTTESTAITDYSTVLTVYTSLAEAPGAVTITNESIEKNAFTITFDEALPDSAKTLDGSQATSLDIEYYAYLLAKSGTASVDEVLAYGYSSEILPPSSGTVFSEKIIRSSATESLRGNARYHVVVKAQIMDDTNTFSTSNVVFVDIPSQATVPPAATNITYDEKGQKSDALDIVWSDGKIVSERTAEGLILKAEHIEYNIYYIRASSEPRTANEIIVNAESVIVTVAADEENKVSMTGLLSESSYEVLVLAINTTDKSLESKSAVTVLETLGRASAPSQPKNVSTSQVTANEFTIKWERPSNTGRDNEGVILSYSDLQYIIYYVTSSNTVTSSAVRDLAASSTDPSHGGILTVEGTKNDVNYTRTISRLVENTEYYYVLAVKNAFVIGADLVNFSIVDKVKTRNNEKIAGELMYESNASLLNNTSSTFSQRLSRDTSFVLNAGNEEITYAIAWLSGIDFGTKIGINSSTGTITFFPTEMSGTAVYIASAMAEGYSNIETTVTITNIDSAIPELITNNAIKSEENGAIVTLTFNEGIGIVEKGKFRLWSDSTMNPINENTVIDILASGPVITLIVDEALVEGNYLRVEMEAGAVRDNAGNLNVAIAETILIETEDNTAPEIAATNPVSTSANRAVIYLQFTEELQTVAGSALTANVSVNQATANVTNVAIDNGDGTRIAITLASPLTAGDNVEIEIPDNLLQDSSGNAVSGLAAILHTVN